MKKIYLLAATVLLLSACGKEEDPFANGKAASSEEMHVNDLAIDSANSGIYTLYNLENGEIVPNSDSASDKWHIGFLSTNIIVNSGTSGPGNTQAQIVKGIYDELNFAPESGYKKDEGGTKAIPGGSGNGWYNYNEEKHVITPIPGRILCFKTTTGKYCKMEIQSYYKGAPANPTLDMPARFYTFRYFFQQNGTTQLYK